MPDSPVSKETPTADPTLPDQERLAANYASHLRGTEVGVATPTDPRAGWVRAQAARGGIRECWHTLVGCF